MRIARRILLVAGMALALTIAAGGALLLLVDADRFRPSLEQAVSAATGSEFRLREPLEIELFPRLAVRLGAGGIGAADEEPPLARWRSIHLGARLLPLLRGRLILESARLEGLALELRRDATGRGNWESLLAGQGGDAASRIVIERLAGVELRDAALRYVDQRAEAGMLREVRIGDWRLDLGAWQPGDPLEFSTGFALALPAPGQRARMTLEARLRPGGPEHELRIAAWSAAIGDSRLHGVATVRIAGAGDDDPGASGQGTIAAESPSLRALLAAAGIEAPPMRDARALGRFRLTSNWRLAGDALIVEPLSVQLDETHLRGRIEASFAQAGTSEFSLNGDRIDLTRYLEPADARGEPFEFPAAQLKALRLRGELKFDQARLADVQMKGVRLGLELEDGRLRAGPLPP